LLGPGPRLVKKKKNLPGRRLTKVEKHCPRWMSTFAVGDTSLHRNVLIGLSIGAEELNFPSYHILCDKDAQDLPLLSVTKYNFDGRSYLIRISSAAFF